MGNDYVSVVYDEKRTPKTGYPAQLINHLVTRFGIKPGNKILEIGYGRGEFLTEFQNIGLECTGVDICKPRDDLPTDISFYVRDASTEKLPFKDETFDVIYHKSMIEHIYNPKHLMDETYRVLKTGGKVIILTPDWESQMVNFYEDFTHSRPYTPMALTDMLKVWNFTNITVEKFYQLPILWTHPRLKILTACLSMFISTKTARWITSVTKLKFVRWSVEKMILGYGEKP